MTAAMKTSVTTSTDAYALTTGNISMFDSTKAWIDIL
jgi:hypothetical protein